MELKDESNHICRLLLSLIEDSTSANTVGIVDHLLL